MTITLTFGLLRTQGFLTVDAQPALALFSKATECFQKALKEVKRSICATTWKSIALIACLIVRFVVLGEWPHRVLTGFGLIVVASVLQFLAVPVSVATDQLDSFGHVQEPTRDEYKKALDMCMRVCFCPGAPTLGESSRFS